MKSKIMYVEYKGDGLAGTAWITRVSFSKTGRSVYFDGRRLETLDGQGYKANYFDIATGERYWVSGPRRDGKDSLYPNTVEIDEDVRGEYWLKIRKRPDLLAHQRSQWGLLRLFLESLRTGRRITSAFSNLRRVATPRR
jgi:hypothetical protein